MKSRRSFLQGVGALVSSLLLGAWTHGTAGGGGGGVDIISESSVGLISEAGIDIIAE